MSFDDFQGFDEIRQQLLDEGLISLPPYPEAPINFFGGSDSTGPILPIGREQIYNVFRSTQHGASAWNTHPAIRLVIEWSKGQLTEPRWLDRNLNSVIFSNIVSTAPTFTVGNIDNDRVKKGGVALLVKSIYNSVSKYDDNIQLDKCNEDIADLNNYLWDNKISFLIMWYRTTFNLWPNESTTYVDTYRGVLCSKAFKTLKQLQAGNGTWLDANLEMFHHFIKLAACGATDGQINEIYRDLTTASPILDPSTFGEIYPGHWRSYGGWISKGYLDFGDLGATKLDAWYAYPTFEHGVMPEMAHLAEDVIRHHGYWKIAPSSSCFSASTRVLMASGQAKAIGEIEPGEFVVSGTSTTDISPRTRKVAFVSKPKRAGRCLYEIASFPGIRFTETHPLLESSANSAGVEVLPRLQFVNRLLAASLNPTWQSFETVTMDSSVLTIYDASEDREEILYDLIFEPDDQSGFLGQLPIYTLQASNGELLSALSEAPLIAWFPLEMVFLGNAIQAILRRDLSVVKLANAIGNSGDSLQSLLRRLATTDVSQHSADSVTDVSLASLLSLGGKSDDSQNISDLIERLIMSLGRAIGNQIYTGWANSPNPHQEAENSIDIVLVHVIRRLPDSTVDTQPVSAEWVVSIDSGGIPLPSIQLEGRIQGHNTVVFHQAIALPPHPDRNGTQGKPPKISINVKLAERSGENVWVGGGTLHFGLQSLLSVGCLAFEGSGNHGILEVELRTVSRDRFEGRHDWKIEKQTTYAANLGYAFGLELLKILYTT